MGNLVKFQIVRYSTSSRHVYHTKTFISTCRCALFLVTSKMTIRADTIYGASPDYILP